MHYKKYHEINLYLSPGSKMCELVKTYFRSSGYDCNEYNVVHDKAAEEKMIQISDQKRTPVTEIDGRVVVGYRPDLFDLILEGKATEE
jgi:arsenate reductase-like glutaredoxin family protein